jgi:iron complex transport system substrate-binding protein
MAPDQTPVSAPSARAARRLLLAFAIALSAPAFAGPAPRRIVSLVPAVTEMLFAIGAAPRVVGVSSFDDYPPEVDRLTRVGGLLDPNVERILALRPDLVIVYGTQSDLRVQLERASIPIFAYKHGGLADVTATIRELGAAVGASGEAERVAGDVETELERVRASVKGRPRPRTILVFGREPMALRSVYVSGGVGFLHDLLELAGGENVFAGIGRESAQISTETIIASAPDAIIELRYGAPLTPAQLAAERAVWNTLATVPAVRTGRVQLLIGDEFVVPGPRIVLAARRLAEVLL